MYLGTNNLKVSKNVNRTNKDKTNHRNPCSNISTLLGRIESLHMVKRFKFTFFLNVWEVCVNVQVTDLKSLSNLWKRKHLFDDLARSLSFSSSSVNMSRVVLSRIKKPVNV